MPDLSGLREGDEIAIRSNRYEPVICRVVKVHKRYLVDSSGQKWRLDNGKQTPRDDGLYRSWAEPATDVHRTLIANAKVRAECHRLLNDLHKRAARDANLAARILNALKPVLNDDDVGADHGEVDA